MLTKQYNLSSEWEHVTKEEFNDFVLFLHTTVEMWGESAWHFIETGDGCVLIAVRINNTYFIPPKPGVLK